MQKLIILDSETGIAYIVECPDDINTDNEDSILEKICTDLDISFSCIQWMSALEINDTTK